MFCWWRSWSLLCCSNSVCLLISWNARKIGKSILSLMKLKRVPGAKGKRCESPTSTCKFSPSCRLRMAFTSSLNWAKNWYQHTRNIVSPSVAVWTLLRLVLISLSVSVVDAFSEIKLEEKRKSWKIHLTKTGLLSVKKFRWCFVLAFEAYRIQHWVKSFMK